MKGQMENQYGTVLIDENVIATYAGSVAVECFGIVGMAAVNVKDGLVKLLKKEHITHGIEVTVLEGNEENKPIEDLIDSAYEKEMFKTFRH